MKTTEKMERRLFDVLCEFHKEKNFVIGVCSGAACDEDRQAIIDFINNGENITPGDVILFGVGLNQKRYPDKYEDIPEEEIRHRKQYRKQKNKD